MVDLTLKILLLFTLIRFGSSNSTAVINYLDQSHWDGFCQGNQQSPINLDVSNGICEKDIIFNLQFSNNIMNFVAEHKNTSVVALGDFSHLTATTMAGNVMSFDSQSLHFHAPSEHSIKGKFFDLELHIVHYVKPEYEYLTNRRLAVLGVLFQVDPSAKPNSLITDVIESVTNKTVLSITPNSILSPFIKTVAPFYMYEGSLTTPECDQIVNWYVVEDPVPISSDQLLFFTSKWKGNVTFANGTAGNNRMIQNLNGRTIKKAGFSCEEKFVYFFSFLILYIFINYFIFKLL